MSEDVLVVSDDAALADDVVRLVAAAGRSVAVAASLVAAASQWATARVVIVGADVELAPVLGRDHVIVATHDDEPSTATWRLAYELRAEHVASLPAAEPWLLQRLDDLGSPTRAHIIGVVGARGGAGATTVAVALACAAAATGSTLLLDADPLGGGIDLAVGSEGVAGSTWRDFANRSGRLPASTLTHALPSRHGVSVLSFDRGSDPAVKPTAAATVLEAARRAFDFVVVDLARADTSVGQVARSLLDDVLIVVPRDVRSLAAASAYISSAVVAPLAVVTRGPAPGSLAVHDVARILSLEVVLDWPYDKTLPSSLERGIAPGSMSRSVHAKAAHDVLNWARAARRSFAA